MHYVICEIIHINIYIYIIHIVCLSQPLQQGCSPPQNDVAMLCEKCCSRQFNIETWKKKQGIALPRNGNGSQCLVFVYNAEQKNDDEACCYPTNPKKIGVAGVWQFKTSCNTNLSPKRPRKRARWSAAGSNDELDKKGKCRRWYPQNGTRNFNPTCKQRRL